MVDPLAAAVGALARGGLVVYPTDTLVGLGASARSRVGVARLLAAKRRPEGVPLSIAVASAEEAEPWADLDPPARAYARRVLPGPVTLLLPSSARARRELAPSIVSADGVVGVRVPDHPVARALAARAGPITATSANRHGAAPVTTLAQARAVFGDEVAVYVPLSPAPAGRPSELIDLAHGDPRAVARS